MNLWCPQPYFVDKSKLIKTFLQNQHKIIMICAPQGFLKTSNMHLLINFIDGISDPAIIDRRKCQWQEQGMKIMKYDLLDTYFGQWPFVHLNFSLCGSACAIQSMVDVIRDQYERNSKIVSGNRLSPAQRVTFQIYRNFVYSKVGAGERKIADAVALLCEMLYTYYEKAVYVFIDNYDFPLLESLAKEKPLLNVQPFLGKMLTSLYRSKAVKKVLLNGISSFTCVPATTNGDVRVATYRFLDDHKFSKYYGFTEDDVVRLCNRSRCSFEITKQILSKPYITAAKNRKLYSPEWLLDYLKHNIIENEIWFEEILQKKVMTMVSIQRQLAPLRQGNEMKMKIGEACTHSDLLQLNRLLNGTITDLDDDEVELLTKFLFELGMFSYVEKCSSLSWRCWMQELLVKIKMNDTSRMAANLKGCLL